MAMCALRLYSAVPASGARCGRVCLGPPPSPLVFFGVVACHVVALWCRSLAFGLRLRVFFVFIFSFAPAWCVSACLGCPFFRWAAAPGLVLPVFGWVVLRRPGGSGPRCRLAGGFGRLSWRGWTVSWLWAFPVPPPPAFHTPLLWLPVPPSALPGLVHALVGIRCGPPGCCWCVGFARSCSGPMGLVGDVHVGLGGLSWWVRFWLCRLGGCARRLCEALG